MRENALRQFFSGDLSANQLALEAAASVKKVGPRETNIDIEDMTSSFSLTRKEVLLLCEAGLHGELPGESITAIAFMLLASDHFEWDGDDEIISEILNDWSCPEVNYPLRPATFQMHRHWLLGSETPPERPALAKSSEKGGLISMRRKVLVKGGP
ncbi:MAG TPA: hypothetical protein VF018_11935 [Acidobacteriaceae bacterium]